MIIRPTIPSIIAPTIGPIVSGGALAWENGGGGAPWSPLDDSSVLVYLDARYGVDAASVGTWTSRVGSVALTQGTGSAKPTQGTSANWGGRTVLTFDGGDYLQNTSISAISTPLTVYAVARANGAAATGWVCDLNTRCSIYQTANAWKTDSVVAGTTLSDGATSTSPVALCLTHGGNGQAVKLYKNDFVTPGVSGTANAAFTTGTRLTAGAYNDATLKFTGDIAAVIIASGVHTATQLVQFRAWMLSDWGV